MLVGDALKSLAKTPGKFDIIMIDVDKPQYIDALNAGPAKITPRRPAGNGQHAMVTAASSTEQATKAPAQSKNSIEKVYGKPTLYPVIVPLRDGVTVAQKL